MKTTLKVKLKAKQSPHRNIVTGLKVWLKTKKKKSFPFPSGLESRFKKQGAQQQKSLITQGFKTEKENHRYSLIGRPERTRLSIAFQNSEEGRMRKMRRSLKYQDKINTAFSGKSKQRVEDIQDNRKANIFPGTDENSNSSTENRCCFHN